MEERPRILGLETEHVVFFVPAKDEETFLSEGGVSLPEPAETPPFNVLESVLFECLLEGRKAALSSGRKGGFFLENGGLAHLELFQQSQADTPILELATPECRCPADVVAYSRAFDSILEETSRRSRAVFHRLGYQGQLSFGKNNFDSRGVGIGCHENYLTHTRTGPVGRWVLAAASPLIAFCLFPIFLLLLLDALRFLICWQLPPLSTLAASTMRWLKAHHPGVLGAFRKLGNLFAKAIHYPFLQVYSLLLRFVVLRTHIRELTPFLVTRQVLTGTGRLNFKAGVYELSQRAFMTRRLATIVLFGSHKTIFDLKGILFDRLGLFVLNCILGLFQSTQRLSITVGDSNLSDLPNLLKLGTTELILEMLEAGETFQDLSFKRPVSALRRISKDGPWKKLPLRSGRNLTALEVQQHCLNRAREFFQDSARGSGRHMKILQLWEESLEKLSDKPQALASDLDWAAKKQLLDRAVLSRTNWKVFFGWGKIFGWAGFEAVSEAKCLEDLLGRLNPIRRWKAHFLVRSASLDPADLPRQRELYFQTRKLELRYHELGSVACYQRALERAGLIRRLTDDQRVEHAVRTPPQDTRARVRGYYIQQSTRPESLHVNWNEIELLGPLRHISTLDPFEHRPPTD